MSIDKIEVTEPKFEFSFQWLVDFIKRILADVFGFIAENEGWTDAEAAE